MLLSEGRVLLVMFSTSCPVSGQYLQFSSVIAANCTCVSIQKGKHVIKQKKIKPKKKRGAKTTGA